MNVLLITTAGVPTEGLLSIPVVLAYLEHLSRRHRVAVVATHQTQTPTRYPLLGAEVLCPGSIPRRWPGYRRFELARRSVRMLNQAGFRPQVIHALGLGQQTSLARMLGAWWRVPVVGSLWSGEMVAMPEIGFGVRGWRNRNEVGWNVRAASAITAGSRYSLEPILRTRPDARWLPWGPNLEGLLGSIERPAGPPWRLMHVGHTTAVKGHGTLLEAFRQAAQALPGLELDWFGHPVNPEPLLRQIKALGLASQVRFHAAKPNAELIPYFRQAHLYLQSSLFESQGLAVMEAGAAGVPIVGSPVGLVAELAPHAAIAVPPADPTALAKQMVHLLTHLDQREQLGKAAQEWVKAHSIDWTVDQFETLYMGLINERTH